MFYFSSWDQHFTFCVLYFTSAYFCVAEVSCTVVFEFLMWCLTCVQTRETGVNTIDMLDQQGGESEFTTEHQLLRMTSFFFFTEHLIVKTSFVTWFK